MITSHGLVSDGLPRAVLEQEAHIVSEHCVANCRVHADARCRSSDDQPLDSAPLENGVEISSVESAVPRLVEYGVSSLRHQFVEDVRIPRIPDEDSAFSPIGGRHRRSNR